VANLLKHAFDLVLAALMDRDFHPGIGFCFPGLFYFRGSRRSIFQHQAVSELLYFGIFQDALDFHEVRFMNMMRGMKTGLRNIAVIGEQE
jgi:hypothetical protein